MKEYSRTKILELLDKAAKTEQAEEEPKGGKVPAPEENPVFWATVDTLQKEGYITDNVRLIRGNIGQVVGSLILCPPVITTKGEEYLAAERQRKWWKKSAVWIFSVIAAALACVLQDVICDFIKAIVP